MRRFSWMFPRCRKRQSWEHSSSSPAVPSPRPARRRGSIASRTPSARSAPHSASFPQTWARKETRYRRTASAPSSLHYAPKASRSRKSIKCRNRTRRDCWVCSETDRFVAVGFMPAFKHNQRILLEVFERGHKAHGYVHSRRFRLTWTHSCTWIGTCSLEKVGRNGFTNTDAAISIP